MLKILIDAIHQSLLPTLAIESRSPFDPVVANAVPPPWRLLGAGNYAAVLHHPDYADYVIKVYAPGREGWAEEVEVYRRLGAHPAFSTCFHAEPEFLVLKRLHGITLYDCLAQGRVIPKQVIQDIDRALAYARDRNLNPHDIHGRNVMMHQGRGLVVDISDFLKPETCNAWNDLKRAYDWFYRPLLAPLRVRVPYPVLDWVRKSYRWFRRWLRRRSAGRQSARH
ncbi:MAG: serine/threonine protein kinase [Cyanobacteria bacterium P01_A01_bin.114]